MNVVVGPDEAEIFTDDSFQTGLLTAIKDFVNGYDWSSKVDWSGVFWSGGAPVSPVAVDSFTVYSFTATTLPSTDITP